MWIDSNLTFRKIGQILVTMIVIAQIGQNLAGKGSDQRHDQPFLCGDPAKSSILNSYASILMIKTPGKHIIQATVDRRKRWRDLRTS